MLLRLFLYGKMYSDADLRRRVLGRNVSDTPASMSGYKEYPTEQGSTIVREEGRVDGGMYLITPVELQQMDEYYGKYGHRNETVLDNGFQAFYYVIEG